MDKILRINMGADGGPAAKTEPLGDYAGFGGRGLTSAIVSKEVPPLCHPVGEDNKLVIAPGLLSGSTAAMSGRLSIGCKSPLTGGIKEANAGGQPSQMIGRLGYAAIVLEGQPKDDTLYKILINKDGVDIQEDNSLCMLGNYDLVDKMKAEHGEKVACISIGPAGEMRMAAASIACTDMEQRPTRHAGRGGVGAVMGSKGVKVIILDDTGMKMRQHLVGQRAGDPLASMRGMDKLFKQASLKAPVISVEKPRRNWRMPEAARVLQPTAATGAVSSAVRALFMIKTANMYPNNLNMKPSGPMVETAASMIWMPSHR